MSSKPFAFVLMPFDSAFDDVYRLGVKAAAEEQGIFAERVDEQIFHNQGILSRIYDQIKAADVIIADMTGQNPNVFYEVGYAHALEKTCVLLTADAADIPFDMKHHRHIVYGSSILTLRERLIKDLEVIKRGADSAGEPIVVEIVSTFGNLEKSESYAEGEMNLTLNVKNQSSRMSPEIETIYFYSGSGWRLTQDDQPCSSMQSDLDKYKRCHLLRSPVRRLPKGGWVEIKLQGRAKLAWGRRNELKDVYKVSGWTVIRVITSERIFDYPLKLDVDFDEIPF